jgi:hypothetical protein
VLADYGISEDAIGCPVRSRMEVVELDSPGLPFGLSMDRLAFESDGVFVINRIKPHTDFHGRFESGLAKMIVIGLGKERQAVDMHRLGVPGLRDGVPRAAAAILATGRIIAGLGLVENAYDETMAVELLPGSEILAREPALLDLARSHMPRLPVDDIDVLVVDRIGKDISGTGMDTNVIGRRRIPGEPEPDAPRIRMVVATDLTHSSHGNATGVGLADVITRRLYGKIDVSTTYTNVFTSGFLERGRIPLVAPTDADAFACAARALGPIAIDSLRIARIRDTLHLGELHLSDLLCQDVAGREDVEVVSPPAEMFDSDGALVRFATG